MGKPSAPKPPDPVKTATAQTGTNIGTAIANTLLGQVNQRTPYGSLRYRQRGRVPWKDPVSGKTYRLPQFRAIQQLSPRGKDLQRTNLKTQQNLSTLGARQSKRLGALLGRTLDTSGLPNAGNVDALTGFASRLGKFTGDAGDITRTYGTDFSKDRERVEAAMFDRMNPQLQQDRDTLVERLDAQGIKLGTEAFDRAMANFDRQSNDARLGVIERGGLEHSRLSDMEARRAAFQNAAQSQQFGQMLGRRQFNNNVTAQQFGMRNQIFDQRNNARQRALGEMFAVRNQPLNEISALMSGSQVRQPGFMPQNMPGIPTTDFAGLVNANYNQRLGVFNNQLNQRNQMLGGLFGIGAALV